MHKLDNILVYHWRAWRGFLISHLIAEDCQLEADYEDTVDTVLNKISPDIKAVLLQINMSDSSRFPAQRSSIIQALERNGLEVLNRDIHDISKHQLHCLLHRAGLTSAQAEATGDGDEWLFVKSNLNWGGEAERRLARAYSQHFNADQEAPIQRWDQYYRVRRADLNPELWQDQRVVIERYVDNEAQSFYRVYGFGTALVVVKGHSPSVIKKLMDDVRDCNYYFTAKQIISERTALPPALQETLKRFIQHTPLSYFCLDIVHDSKNYFIVDLNLTPYSGEQPQNSDAIHFLVTGANEYLKTHERVESLETCQ